jgi:hypothetical protein
MVPLGLQVKKDRGHGARRSLRGNPSHYRRILPLLSLASVRCMTRTERFPPLCWSSARRRQSVLGSAVRDRSPPRAGPSWKASEVSGRLEPCLVVKVTSDCTTNPAGLLKAEFLGPIGAAPEGNAGCRNAPRRLPRLPSVTLPRTVRPLGGTAEQDLDFCFDGSFQSCSLGLSVARSDCIHHLSTLNTTLVHSPWPRKSFSERSRT